VDDPIATALRHAQRELRTVVAKNKARKARLASIARDRLGYQEYLDLRDSIDKNIWSTYTKLQRKDLPKLGKKKKKVADANGNASGSVPPSVTAVPAPSPAAVGFIVDDECRLSLSESLKQLMETRRQWVDVVGGVFEEKQRENPGRIWGLPKKSIYEGIEEEVKREVERSMLVDPSTDFDPRTNDNNNGKGTARGGEMDVG
jgi:transcriptional adapter 3